MLFAFLASMVAGIFGLATLPGLRIFFRYFPPLIWCYFLPMILSSLDVIPNRSPLYGGFMLDVVLPFIVVLLLVPMDTAAIARVGPQAVVVMLIGTAGIVAGAAGSFAFFQAVLPEGTLPEGMWKAVASLSGSWIGGSPNMAAIKASLNLDETLFGKIVVIDTVCGYSWLAVLIALAPLQGRVDRMMKADASLVGDLSGRLARRQAERCRPLTLPDFILMLAVGMGVGQVCLLLGRGLSDRIATAEAAGGLMHALRLSQVLSGFGWGMLIATVAGVALSFTRLQRIGDAGATAVGNAGLYLLLTTFGAQADLRQINPRQDVWLVALGALWLFIHVLVLFAGMRLCRAPLFLGAAASMANVGGTASAPVVAAAFHPSLAPLGLILAILGGILGTPVGLLVVGKLCAAIAGGP
ncbi:MAG: hypothetical protein AMXMBFR83_23860 [Phycisphaerae bacterium]